MTVMGVKINHHNNDVGKIFGMFAISDQLVAVDRKKLEAPIALKGRVLSADLIHPGDKIFEVPGTFNVPRFNFILFGIQIFLAPSLPGPVLA